MSKGLKVASWVSVILMIAACYGTFIVSGIGDPIIEDTSASADSAVSGLVVMMVIVPITQIISITIGIIVATRKNPDTIRTTRVIMLVVKLGLIPFFIFGGIAEVMFFIMGIHPVLIAFGWGMAFALGVMGWFTVVAGGIWSIATVVQMRRCKCISSGEAALHIVLQFFFVADVIDSIAIFARSSNSRISSCNSTASGFDSVQQ